MFSKPDWRVSLKSTAAKINEYTKGDITYGLNPVVEQPSVALYFGKTLIGAGGEEDNNLTANNVYFKEVPDESGLQLTLEETLRKNLVGLITDRYDSAVTARGLDESRWLTAYHNYRGLYAKNVRFRESEKSRVFVKVTKTKVLAAFGQQVDVIFGANKFPIGVSETKVPEGISEYAHLDTQNPVPGIETTPQEETEEGG